MSGPSGNGGAKPKKAPVAKKIKEPVEVRFNQKKTTETKIDTQLKVGKSTVEVDKASETKGTSTLEK